MIRTALALLVSSVTVAAQSEPRIKSDQRSATSPEGETVQFEVGTLYAPENRSDKSSRTIGIGFARILGTDSQSPPIFLLPGGPGGSYVDRFRTRSPRALTRALRDFGVYRGFADLVIVDQRGFSKSGDVLYVSSPRPDRPKDRPWTTADQVEHDLAHARQVVTDHASRGIDLRGYTVIECAHDVADIARLLGYESITLKGTSFGSQWSFAVMKLHPQLVARALLSGVEPLNHAYDMPSHVLAAARRIWRHAESLPKFANHVPEGGIAAAAEAVIRRLESAPIPAVVDGRESTGPELTLGPDDFPWFDPGRILELYHGQPDRWAVQAGMRALAGTRKRALIGPLIDSSLGVTPERRHQLWTDPAVRYVSRANFASYLACADVWPSPDVGDAFRNPAPSAIPVVFAQGTWDIQTPIENTLEIAPYFTNSHVLIADRGGHGVFRPLADELPEVWSELLEFLRTGDMNGIPVRVELEPSWRFTPPLIRQR